MIRWLLVVSLFGFGGDVWAGPKAAGEACSAHDQCQTGLHCVGLVCKDLTPGPDPCLKGAFCKQSGRCTSKDGECIVGSDADCRLSDQCEKDGRCALGIKHGYPQCLATSDADCKATKRCKDNGKCTAKEGECIIGSDADCKASKYCTLTGKCTVKDGYWPALIAF